MSEIKRKDALIHKKPKNSIVKRGEKYTLLDNYSANLKQNKVK